jgi:outer membrane protein assembly factor BamD (BamD/ComL family)
MARLEESQSRPEGALAYYQQLIKTYPNSPFTSEATIRTKVLDVKSKEPSSSAPAPPPQPNKQP